MKRKFLLCCVLFISCAFAAAAQDYNGMMTVYSEEGENFTLYIDGDQKNGTPAARVVADHIVEVTFTMRVVFENTAIPELKKKGIRAGKNCVYAVHKNKKGEHALKIKECTDLFDQSGTPTNDAPSPSTATEPTPAVPLSSPDQLSASYSNGLITINDGRTLTVTKVKVNGMTYPRVLMNAPTGAKVSISYDDNTEKYSAEVPFKYEVKDYSNNNSYLTLTVDEGGPAKTWHVKLQNANGYDLKID